MLAGRRSLLRLCLVNGSEDLLWTKQFEYKVVEKFHEAAGWCSKMVFENSL